MAISLTRRTKLTHTLETVQVVTSANRKHHDARVNGSVGIQMRDEDGTIQDMVISVDAVPLLIKRLQRADARCEQSE